MSKLVVTDSAGTVLLERELDRERIRIGRRADNDIQLDDLAVSNEHALVTTIRNDSFIQDLNSMNGVRVNGRLIKHHHLQPGDEITIAGFRLRYVHEPWVMPEHSWVPPETRQLKQATIQAMTRSAGSTLFAVEVDSGLGLAGDLPDTAMEGPPGEAPTSACPEARPGGAAFIRLVAGPGSGREAQLTRPVTTLGKPGVQTAAISRHGGGYFLTHVEGERYPQVNGVEVGATPQLLKDHDILDIAGTRLEFFYR